MGCIMPKKKKNEAAASEVIDTNDGACPANLKQMKRRDLQKLCKKLNLRAVGKNIDLIERIQSYYNELELKEINSNKQAEDGGVENFSHCSDEVVDNKEKSVGDIDISVEISQNDKEENNDAGQDDLNKEEQEQEEEVQGSPSVNKVLSNTSSPKDWSWIARWCVVDGVLKQDAKERWVLLQLTGGRVILFDEKTNEHSDFVLEPSVLPTPEEYEDNYVCGDCVRKNSHQLSGWIGLQRRSIMETPKSSLDKENIDCNKSDARLLRQSFKRKRDEVFSSPTGLDFIEIGNKPLKVQKLNPGPSCSPASPSVRRERGEDFQLPKNLLKPWKPKKTKCTPPKEDPDFAQKVEKIITNLSPEEQLTLVFGAKKPSVMHSPHPKS